MRLGGPDEEGLSRWVCEVGRQPGLVGAGELEVGPRPSLCTAARAVRWVVAVRPGQGSGAGEREGPGRAGVRPGGLHRQAAGRRSEGGSGGPAWPSRGAARVLPVCACDGRQGQGSHHGSGPTVPGLSVCSPALSPELGGSVRVSTSLPAVLSPTPHSSPAPRQGRTWAQP